MRIDLSKQTENDWQKQQSWKCQTSWTCVKDRWLKLVLLKRGTENKYEAPYKGLYNILHINDNWTVHLKVGAVEGTYNIWRLTPYIQADASNHGGECNISTQRRRSVRQQALSQDSKGMN